MASSTCDIMNGDICKKVVECGVAGTVKYLQTICDISENTLRHSVDRLAKKHKKLKQSKHRVKGERDLELFLEKVYVFPEPKESREESSRADPFHKEDDPQLMALAYKHVAYKLGDELKAARENVEDISEELDVTINEKDELNESLEKITGQAERKKTDLKRTATRENYWREKCRKLEQNEYRYTEEDIDMYVHQIAELKTENHKHADEIGSLKKEMDELKQENEKLCKMRDAILYDENSRTYSTELHMCVYSLLNNNVGTEHVSEVINSVLKVVNLKPNKLPSSSTINNWSLERGILSRKQLSSNCEDRETTLHTDEASKYGNKWGAFASRNKEGEYHVLGLRDMATKSSQDTLDTFKDILMDIDSASERETKGGQKILTNIKNTMSDRAATETKFNSILEEYRKDILPEVVENYQELNDESKEAIDHVNNFFCGLHSLVHMAETCQKSLYEAESAHYETIPNNNPSFNRPGQPGTVRLILTAGKSFARRGDQKNGCHGKFKTFVKPFLRANNMQAMPLQPLKGNRFNILFVNAGHIYFLQHEMKTFLEKLPSMNGLLASVLHDLNEPFFVAGCKALGLISKFITTPLWNVIESKNISMSEMSERYLTLKLYLQEAVNNPDDFMRGDLKLFDDVNTKKDKVYDRLIEESDIDGHVQVIISIILPALTKLISRQFKDHLPGGKHEHLNVDQTRSVDKHNKFPERIFSYLDHILSTKPNISTLAIESHISFSLNKTSEWLNEQENMADIIKESRREVTNERKKFKERELELEERRQSKQQQEFRMKEEQERRRVEKLERETTDMAFYGLWQSSAVVESELEKIRSKTEKEEALKVQLRFRKNVFKQKGGTHVYNFTQVVDGKRIPLSIEELKGNVKSLISNACDAPPPNTIHLLVGKNIRHKFLVDEEEQWFQGHVISQVPGYPDWFNVRYADDEAIYTSKLSEEYLSGDVELIPM